MHDLQTTSALPVRELKFSCPYCQQKIACDEAYGGAEIDCPSCSMAIVVPDAAPPPAAPTGGGLELNIDDTRSELQGFREHYAREILPFMATVRVQQRAARKRLLLAGPLGTAVTILLGWWLFGSYGVTYWTFMIVGVVAGVTLVLAFEKLWKLQGDVKGFLLLEICRFFGFTYSEQAPDAVTEDFDISGLLPKYDQQRLEDHIRGNRNGVDFDMTECRLTVKKGRGENRRDSEVYHGVLFRFTFPKRFKGRTLVIKDRGLIGNFLKSFKTTGERVKLEDPRFEKSFEVWGTDQIEARYLLTPIFMERLVDLANSISGNQFEVCFAKNLLLVSVHISKDQFEAGGIFSNMADKRHVEVLVDEIGRVFDILDTLQLTLKTRI